jgi:hypothetical protein
LLSLKHYVRLQIYALVMNRCVFVWYGLVCLGICVHVCVCLYVSFYLCVCACFFALRQGIHM